MHHVVVDPKFSASVDAYFPSPRQHPGDVSTVIVAALAQCRSAHEAMIGEAPEGSTEG